MANTSQLVRPLPDVRARAAADVRALHLSSPPICAVLQAAREHADAAYPDGYEPTEDEESAAWRGTGG
ncbi:hypothetical protein [Streptomyces sp. WAC 04229]|uniref:hypothetical protein n=1 Tax=Streptomyces sp. WAC 04229 TaxID=2203206 RepID=UPI003D735B6C